MGGRAADGRLSGQVGGVASRVQTSLNIVPFLNVAMGTVEITSRDEFREMYREAVSGGILKQQATLATTRLFRDAVPASLNAALVQAYTPAEMKTFFRGECGRIPQYELARRLMNDFLEYEGIAGALDDHVDMVSAAHSRLYIGARAFDLGLATLLMEEHLSRKLFLYRYPLVQPGDTSVPPMVSLRS